MRCSAGTVNGDGALEITATRAVGDRTLDRVIRLVEEAQAAKRRSSGSPNGSNGSSCLASWSPTSC